MRALIIASVSGRICTDPLSTSVTNCFTMSLPRSFVAASRPRRPSSTILSRSPSSLGFAKVVSACVSVCMCGSVMAASRRDFRLQLAHGVGVVDRLLEDLIQLLVPLEGSAEIGELGAELEKLLEGTDALRHRLGGEVVERFEGEIDAELVVALRRQLVVHAEL